MAKKSMMAREAKRARLAQRYAARRAELRKRVKDESLDYEEREAAMYALQKLPRDSARVRRRNRCALTGRPHGYFRKYGLSRNKLREVILVGQVPGVTKSSW
ncbi:MAG: 30S ribosomal protein S14 [Gammaproteobacteria bacterium]|nr:MAG: 30S ribosomal protein S14 [Gammaproteobacteria bacterium]